MKLSEREASESCFFSGFADEGRAKIEVDKKKLHFHLLSNSGQRDSLGIFSTFQKERQQVFFFFF